MNDVPLDSPRPVTGTGAETTPEDRTETIQQLYFNHSPELRAAAFDAYPALIAPDAYRIMLALASSLHRYGGPPEDKPFLKWATRFVRKEAERFRITLDILSKYRRVIESAIRDSLWATTALDVGQSDPEDIFGEVAALIFERAHSLNRKGRAKLSTRLSALVRKHVWLYHNARNQRRLRKVERLLTSIACTQLSTEEQASIRAEQGEETGAFAGVDFG